MLMRISRQLPPFITLMIITIALFLFNAGCNKGPKDPATGPGKLTPGNPAIVYTDVNPDSMIIKIKPSSYTLDLNNDGVADFQFYAIKGSCADGLIAPVVSMTYLSAGPAAGGNMIMTNDKTSQDPLSLATALDSNISIAPDSLWAGTSQYLLYGAATGGYIRCMIARGNWFDVADKYLGLKFVKGNHTYYGWARFSSTYQATAAPYRHLTNGQLILKDYAYNSIADQPILAGQTK